MYKILIIEDEEVTAIALDTFLTSLDYKVIDCVNSASEVYKSLELELPDLIISDIMIKGGISGCELSKDINLKYNIPIIFLTAYCDDEMLQYATDANAYGYILKPYKENELKAMVKLALNHSKNKQKTQHNIKFENYSFNTQTNKIFLNNQEVKLGKKSLKLLEILIKNQNNPVSFETLINEIWLNESEKSIDNLRQLVKRTKEKLDTDSIESVKNMGYIFKI